MVVMHFNHILRSWERCESGGRSEVGKSREELGNEIQTFILKNAGKVGGSRIDFCLCLSVESFVVKK